MNMRQLLLYLLLMSAAYATAQEAKTEFRTNKNLSASGYLAYPGPRKALTPAPKGYRPFYISHYGRHGSRYLIGTNDYDRPYNTLLKADSLGKLTQKGKETLEKVRMIRQEAMHRDGELTQRGAEQHRQIAQRMYRRFPEVFADSARVDAKSTVVIRCILSMENALQELVAINPKLRITHDASHHDMYYMNQDDSILYNKKWSGGGKEAWNEFRSRHDHHQHTMRQLFNDDGYWQDSIKASDLAYQLFVLASNVQSTELRHTLTLYDLFDDEEIYDQWAYTNAFWYLNYGPSTLNGGTQPFSQRNLLRKIIAEADSCLAFARPGATLRYGHDTMVMPLTCLLDLNGYGQPIDGLDRLDANGWHDYRIFPMACNIQLVFYRRSASDKEVLVKVLLNEDEATLPIASVSGPYYRWSDVRDYYTRKLDTYKE